MKCLTLTQPYASLVSTGDKKLETRDWPTSYRGPLAIHAAKSFPPDAMDFCWRPDVHTMLERAGFAMLMDMRTFDLPLGVFVATCQLVGCLKTEDIDFRRFNSKERILGNFAPNRFAFVLEDIVRLKEPVPARGQLGLWEWDADAAGITVTVTGKLF